MSQKFVTSVAALAALSLATSALAVSVTDGNATFTVLTTGPGASTIWSGGTGLLGGDLITDTGGPDYISNHGWLYGTGAAGGSTLLQDFGTATSIGNPVVTSVAGNQLTIRVNNFGTSAGGFVDGTWVYTLVDGAVAGSATVNVAVTLTNRGATAANVRLGAYTNIHAAGTVANDAVTAGANGLATYVDGTSGATTSAPGSTSYQYGEAGAIGTALTQQTLNNTPALAASALFNDAASGNIYSIIVPAGVGQTSTINYSLSVSAIPEPTALLGLAALPLVLRRRSK